MSASELRQEITKSSALLREQMRDILTHNGTPTAFYTNYTEAHNFIHRDDDSDESWIDTIQSLYNPQALDRMDRSALYSELSRIKSTLSQMSSRFEFAQRITKTQEDMIFGDSSVRLDYGNLTNQQRSAFWRLYEEFKHMYPQISKGYGYGSIPEMITTVYSENMRSDFRIDANLMEIVRERLEAINYEISKSRSRNVLTGIRND